MSAVVIHQWQVDNLPGLCMRCGMPATTRRGKTFSKAQGWVSILPIFGGLPWVICSALFRDRFHVRVPLCDGHRNHFNWQAGILWGGMALVAMLLAGCFAAIAHVDDQTLSRCFGFAGIVAAIWVILFVGNRFYGMTVAIINDDSAIIVGVSHRFAEECEREGQHVHEVARY